MALVGYYFLVAALAAIFISTTNSLSLLPQVEQYPNTCKKEVEQIFSIYTLVQKESNTKWIGWIFLCLRDLTQYKLSLPDIQTEPIYYLSMYGTHERKKPYKHFMKRFIVSDLLFYHGLDGNYQFAIGLTKKKQVGHYIIYKDKSISDEYNLHEKNRYIPLFNMKNAQHMPDTQPINFIQLNGKDFRYNSGIFKIDGGIRFDTKPYHIGFDEKWNRVYYGKSEELLLAGVQDFVPASNVLNNSHLIAFSCLNHVYLVTPRWVFIIPQFDLFEELKTEELKDQPVFYGEMLVISRELFIQCDNKLDMNAKPKLKYPDTKLHRYVKPPKLIFKVRKHIDKSKAKHKRPIINYPPIPEHKIHKSVFGPKSVDKGELTVVIGFLLFLVIPPLIFLIIYFKPRKLEVLTVNDIILPNVSPIASPIASHLASRSSHASQLRNASKHSRINSIHSTASSARQRTSIKL